MLCWKKVTGTFCAKHPSGRSGKRCLSPFALRTMLSGALAVAFCLPVPAADDSGQAINEFARFDFELEQLLQRALRAIGRGGEIGGENPSEEGRDRPSGAL